jgi:hypothetical protein
MTQTGLPCQILEVARNRRAALPTVARASVSESTKQARATDAAINSQIEPKADQFAKPDIDHDTRSSGFKARHRSSALSRLPCQRQPNSSGHLREMHEVASPIARVTSQLMLFLLNFPRSKCLGRNTSSFESSGVKRLMPTPCGERVKTVSTSRVRTVSLSAPPHHRRRPSWSVSAVLLSLWGPSCRESGPESG